LASSMFFEKFQMPTHQKPVGLAVPGPARRVDVVDNFGDRLLRTGDQDLVLFRRLEGVDRVVDGNAFTGVEAAVVARVVPCQYLRLHRLGIEPLDEFHRVGPGDGPRTAITHRAGQGR